MTSIPAIVQRAAQNDLKPNIEFVKLLGAPDRQGMRTDHSMCYGHTHAAFFQLRAENAHCCYYAPCCRVLRRLRWSIPRHHCAQFHRAPASRVQGREARQKPLAGAKGAEPPCASESITGGDRTALNGVGGVAATARSPRAHMAGQWKGCSHGFSVRLVVVSDNGTGWHVCAGQGLSKKGCHTGPGPFAPP